MHLIFRTFAYLKPYWRHVAVSSVSAALHALLASLLVWMAGPLLMTLFEAAEPVSPESTQQNVTNTAEMSQETGIEGNLQKKFDFLVRTKNNMKELVHDLVTGSDRKETLLNFCVLILVIAFSSNLFLYLQGYFMAFVQQSIVRDFRNLLFGKYQLLSLSYFHKRRTGQIISRVTNDVIVLNDTVDLGFNRLIVDSLTVLILAAFLILLSWKLTLLAALVLPLVFGFIYLMGKKLRKYSRRSQERMADVNSVLEESISNVRIVKAYAMEKFETSKFHRTTRAFFRALVKMTRARRLAGPVNEILIVAAGVVILLFAGTRIIEGRGELDAGDFMTFIIAMFAMIKPIKELFNIHVRLQEGMAAAERIFNVIDAPVTVREIPDAISKTRFDGIIKYDNVTFAYIEAEPVIRNLTFEVKRGEIVALVGPSGAGKSTIVDLLPRFYDPGEGRILIDDIDIRKIKLDDLRKMMGIVTQETYLFNDTIRNNIAYGLNDVPFDDVVQAARMANADDFIRQFDRGYETVVGSRGVRLSGGQKQRVSIARALLKNPQILIFDEATSALDTEAEILVQEAINHLMKNRTTLVIAHRLSTIKNADKILVIDGGQIIEYGRHDELLGKNGMYHKLYMMQFRNAR